MSDVREDVMNICSALGIDLRGLGDDTLEVIGQRIVAEDVWPTKPNIERIVDEVKRAEGGQAKTVDSPESTAVEEPAPSAHPKYRFNATEATEAKYRQRMALAHRSEDSRTGLYLVPRRPEVMRPGAVHPACLAAYEEDATPCSYCIPLLHPADCACDVCMEFWAAMDS